MSNTRGWVSPPDDHGDLHDDLDDLTNDRADDNNTGMASASPTHAATNGAPAPTRRISAARWALLWLNVGLLALCVTLAAANMSLLHIGSAGAGVAPTVVSSPTVSSQATSNPSPTANATATATETATPTTTCCATGPTVIPTQQPTRPPATPTPVPTTVRNN